MEKITRRDFLKLSAKGLLAYGASKVLTACGVENPSPITTNLPPTKFPTALPDGSPTPDIIQRENPEPPVLATSEFDDFDEWAEEQGFNAVLSQTEKSGYLFGEDGKWIYAYNRKEDSVAAFLKTEAGWQQMSGAKVFGGKNDKGEPTEDVIWNKEIFDSDGKVSGISLVLKVESPKVTGGFINLTWQSPETKRQAYYQIDPSTPDAEKVQAAPKEFLNPKSWKEYKTEDGATVVVRNENLNVFGQQFEVASGMETQFANEVNTLCNRYTFMTEMAKAHDDQQTRDRLSSPKYNDYNTYLSAVIKPAIANGSTIEAWSLIGHPTWSYKRPDAGEIKPLSGDIDPSICSVRLGTREDIKPGSVVIAQGPYQVGMNVVEKDGKNIRELIVLTKNGIDRNGYPFLSDERTPEENARALSETLHIAAQDLGDIADLIASSTRSDQYRHQFCWIDTKTRKYVYSFSVVSGSKPYVDKVAEWKKESPNYFTTITP